jgi:hypothetical protein
VPVTQGEVAEKPFGNAVNRIDRGYGHDPAIARSDTKAKKPLYLLLAWGEHVSLAGVRGGANPG